MADLGELSNNESGEQAVSAPEPRSFAIDVLEPNERAPCIEAGYTNVEPARDFENFTTVVMADTAPTVIQVNSFIAGTVRISSAITDILRVQSEIQN
ncbi:MAG: hypothetical protein HZA78_08045 [Candidatus Schekmanbacteria bacterium]|nr:hypothetical protein [Candidatus Schekmanbacteria bacterium]